VAVLRRARQAAAAPVAMAVAPAGQRLRRPEEDGR
jgi:hypothetical protein